LVPGQLLGQKARNRRARSPFGFLDRLGRNRSGSYRLSDVRDGLIDPAVAGHPLWIQCDPTLARSPQPLVSLRDPARGPGNSTRCHLKHPSLSGNPVH
jgi:hypothetical protein